MFAELTARLRRSSHSNGQSSSTSQNQGVSTQETIQAIEAEVTRLTWSVMDGVASEEDKQRLKELVGRQHQARQTCENAMQLESDLTAIFAGSH